MKGRGGYMEGAVHSGKGGTDAVIHALRWRYQKSPIVASRWFFMARINTK